MYDIIGDIHGHADELKRLLQILGYENKNNVYRHPERKVIFLGDFIDRGPRIREVLQIVRTMVDEDAALAIMGNHEFNAIAFHSQHLHRAEVFLRRRSNKNIRQHSQTILQMTDKHLSESIAWFRTLPIWLDLNGLRVVHACWDEKSISTIQSRRLPGESITPDFLQDACEDGTELFHAVETILKGKEVLLPDGRFFLDKDGHARTTTRTRWYATPSGQTYRSYAFAEQVDCDEPLDAAVIQNAVPYLPNSKPLFMGHYWLSTSQPAILAENVACLDYSVAKGGFLCAYRWDGEQKLTNDHFVWVGNPAPPDADGKQNRAATTTVRIP